MRIVRWFLTLALVLAVATVPGCGDDDDDGGTEVPNPASAYCEEQGGTVEMERGEDGERGICVLPDGRRVDEWELYRERGG